MHSKFPTSEIEMWKVTSGKFLKSKSVNLTVNGHLLQFR